MVNMIVEDIFDVSTRKSTNMIAKMKSMSQRLVCYEVYLQNALLSNIRTLLR